MCFRVLGGSLFVHLLGPLVSKNGTVQLGATRTCNFSAAAPSLQEGPTVY